MQVQVQAGARMHVRCSHVRAVKVRWTAREQQLKLGGATGLSCTGPSMTRAHLLFVGGRGVAGATATIARTFGGRVIAALVIAIVPVPACACEQGSNTYERAKNGRDEAVEEEDLG